MNRPIDRNLPVVVYRVGDTCFPDQQIEAMIKRTNRKLQVAGIEIKIANRRDIREKSFAFISQATDVAYENLRQLLQYGSGPNKFLRIFLVKVDVQYRHDSWTYDPLANPDDQNLWGGAIFITELYNDNSDQRYVDLGLLPSNDTLLHEIGHVLMQQTDHYAGPRRNFFHERAELTDDTIFPPQIAKMRGEPPLKGALQYLQPR